jgi:Bacterial Ig domain
MRMNHGSRLSARVVAPLLLSLALSIALVGTTFAKGRPGGGGGGGKTCTQSAPGVSVDNTYGWSQWGSWGMPGQQLSYAINVINYDVGCGASTFVIDVEAPSDFTVSVPTDTISLKASANGYLRAYVTASTGVLDGDYPLVVSVRRSGTLGPVGSFTTSFKVYSTDTTAPSLFWANPGDGQVIDARTVSVTASSSDDHAVRSMDLYVDGTRIAGTTCDGVSYICQITAAWTGGSGSHTATFWAYDWMGNAGSLSVSFTAGGASATSTTSLTTTLATTTTGGSRPMGASAHGKSTHVAAGSKYAHKEHGPTK